MNLKLECMELKLSKLEYNGIKIYYRKGSTDEDVITYSLGQDIFLKEIRDFKLTRDIILIDIGAHIGTFSVIASQKAPNGKIYAVEASKDTFRILKKTVEENNIRNIICVNSAISHSDGTEKLFLSPENWEHSITKEFTGEFELVKSYSLKTFFQEYDLKCCDLIKFNCEGAEFSIIFSTPPEALKKIKMMLILFHEDMVDNKNHNRNNLKEYLRKNNFLIRTVKENEIRGWIIAKNRSFYSVSGHNWFVFKDFIAKKANSFSNRIIQKFKNMWS